MDISHLIRDANKVHNALSEVNNTLVALKPCKIYIPERYLTADLASTNDVVKIVGIYGIVIEDKYYASSKACAFVELDPAITNYVKINNESYLEFYFGINDTIIKNLNLVRMSTLVYRIYNNIIAKGKIPWYLNYTDLCMLFDTAFIHGNANLKADSSLLELFISTMARQHEDKAKFFRHESALLDLNVNPFPVYIPLNSVAYNTTNTTAKLLGNYFSEGLNSALVNPADTTESIETILRN